jgi:HEPN domain-containing protein
MKQPEEEVRRLAAEWMRKAHLDLLAVERLRDDGALRDIAVFHAQQAVEKYLKALLTWRQVEFPRTHEIRRLLELMREVEAHVAESLQDARWLDPFGVEIRYPGDGPETLPGDEDRALELARAARERVESIIGTGS